MDAEEGVGGGGVQGGRRGAGRQEGADGDLCGPGELQLLQLRLVVLVVLHELVQEGLVLLLGERV